MWYFTEVADWFEGKRAQSNVALDQWVEESNYSQGAMLVAASTQAITTFSAGFVDVLRLGDGVKQGSLKGMGQDALRVVAIFPVGKAASIVKSARGVTLAKAVVDTGGPNCFWVASAKAFRQLGQRYSGKLLVSVDDVAKALGMQMNGLWKIPNLATGIAYLQKIGAKVGPVRAISATSDISKLVPPINGGVVMIAVRVESHGQVIGGHAIYAFRNALGQIRYMDRTVGRVVQATVQGTFKSIADIAPLYGATALVPYEAAVISNMFVKSVAADLPRLVIPILGVVATKDNK
jgi:hypothetical protein